MSRYFKSFLLLDNISHAIHIFDMLTTQNFLTYLSPKIIQNLNDVGTLIIGINEKTSLQLSSISKIFKNIETALQSRSIFIDSSKNISTDMFFKTVLATMQILPNTILKTNIVFFKEMLRKYQLVPPILDLLINYKKLIDDNDTINKKLYQICLEILMIIQQTMIIDRVYRLLGTKYAYLTGIFLLLIEKSIFDAFPPFVKQYKYLRETAGAACKHFKLGNKINTGLDGVLKS